ncbi:MAG TPA: hypothetical protein VJJ80_00970 [Patescibacteria group bacterium]|nr:hypothetical protein [Patescibacteria group bacterium]
MILASKEILENVKKQANCFREDLEKEKDELENLENQFKVEERILVELEEKNDELAETQKYIVLAVKDEIEIQKNKIVELETDLKLLCKKHEVLNRDTWNF